MSLNVKGIPIEFGSQTLIVPPISLGELEKLQERLQKFTGDFKSTGDISVVIDAAFASLKRNYPEIDRESVANGIGLENMNDIFEAVMDVSGQKRKRLEAAAAAGVAV